MNNDCTWPIENPLSLMAIKNRVDIARMLAYKKFITCIDEEDFYIVEILNIFLSYAQQPLNFVIFKGSTNEFIHFCNDKEHFIGFEKYIKEEVKKWKDIETHAFPLFPALDLNYFISPVFMQTKNHGSQSPYVIVENDMSSEFNATDMELTIGQLLIARDDIAGEITNKDILIEYIRVVTWYFFCDEWDAHKTYFSAPSSDTSMKIGLPTIIKTSIENISNSQFQPTKCNIDVLDKTLRKIGFPNNTQDREDNWLGSDWKDVLSKTLFRIVRDRTFGLELLSGMHHQLENDDCGVERTKILNVTNMILAYRSYTRGNDDKNRHNVKRIHSDKEGEYDSYYSYDVCHLLFEESSESPYVNYFREFWNNYINNNISYESDGRVYYKNILQNQEADLLDDYKIDKTRQAKIEWYKKLAVRADELFWTKIREDEGKEYIIKLLSMRESDCIRSVCDPVFNTGLIHFNNIFQYFGLDRIRGLEGEGGYNIGKSSSEIEISGADLEVELLKMASFYYLFSGMAAWDNGTKGNSPGDLAAVLVPIKVRGVVWGVGIHATYFSNPDLNKKSENLNITLTKGNDIFPFHRQQTWSFINILTTSLSEHYCNLIDQALWRNACLRIRNLIRRHIGLSSEYNFDDSLKTVSEIIKAEQRVIPYSLPHLSFEKPENADSGSMMGRERIGTKKNGFNIYWEVKNNEIFKPHQEWKYKGTRSFEEHIKYGIKEGLKDMKKLKRMNELKRMKGILRT